jgi:tRNA U34 5-carboxymethylaminomethyl modifying enzyme MnmG/GidA
MSDIDVEQFEERAKDELEKDENILIVKLFKQCLDDIKYEKNKYTQAVERYNDMKKQSREEILKLAYERSRGCQSRM